MITKQKMKKMRELVKLWCMVMVVSMMVHGLCLAEEKFSAVNPVLEFNFEDGKTGNWIPWTKQEIVSLTSTNALNGKYSLQIRFTVTENLAARGAYYACPHPDFFVDWSQVSAISFRYLIQGPVSELSVSFLDHLKTDHHQKNVVGYKVVRPVIGKPAELHINSDELEFWRSYIDDHPEHDSRQIIGGEICKGLLSLIIIELKPAEFTPSGYKYSLIVDDIKLGDMAVIRY